MSTKARTDLDVQKFVGILGKGPAQWTDEEFAELDFVNQPLANELHRLARIAGQDLEIIRRYRLRKKELGQLPTEELEKRGKKLREGRLAAMTREEHLVIDLDDDDHLYEAPPMDSDRYIVSELLRERRSG